jgi:hypothetical protein
LVKKLSVGGFRLDLGEPLAGQLTEFCKRKHRKKTEVVREALEALFEHWAEEEEKQRLSG